jgi:hypothetical protein
MAAIPRPASGVDGRVDTDCHFRGPSVGRHAWNGGDTRSACGIKNATSILQYPVLSHTTLDFDGGVGWSAIVSELYELLQMFDALLLGYTHPDTYP